MSDGNPNITDLKTRFGSMIIREVLEKHPEILPVLFDHMGGSCWGCPAAGAETLEQAMAAHDVDADQFYRDLAEVLKSKAE